MIRRLSILAAALALALAPAASAQVITSGPVADSRIICKSAVASPITGTLTETTLATCTVPGGSMGPNGQVEITVLWSYTNSANTKTLKIKFASSAFQQNAVTTTATFQQYIRISNRNSASSQVGFAAAAGNGIGSSSGGTATAAVNSGADVALTFTGTLTNTGETITLESYLVRLIPG